MSMSNTGDALSLESSSVGDLSVADSRKSLFLSALAIVAFCMLWFGFNQGDRPDATMPSASVLLWLAPLALTGATAAWSFRPALSGRSSIWARLLLRLSQVPTVWYVAGTAALTSFVVAQVANTSAAPENYWPLFWLWLASIALLLGWALSGLPWSLLRRPRALVETLRPHRWEIGVVAALTLVALVVRTVNLSSLPDPFSGDEAAFGERAVSVLNGVQENMFISELHGSPTMYFFIIAGFYKIVGVSVFGIRLLSALMGAATIPVLYLLLRDMFNRQVALFGAAYLVAYHFHLHYSRIGLNNIGDPLALVLTLYFCWRASRYQRPVDFVLTGMAAGFSLYFWQAGRIAPMIVVALFAFTALRRPAFIKQNFFNFGLTGLAYGVVGFPLGIYWLTHWDEFMTRMNEVGIFQSGWMVNQREATGKGTIELLWEQTTRAFSSFGNKIDTSPHYLAPISFVDRLSFIPFVLGSLYAAARIRQERYFILIFLFVASVVAGGVLTIDPPTSPRLLPPILFVAAMVGLGVWAIGAVLARWRPTVGLVAASLVLATLFGYNLHFYFFRYGPGNYYSDYNTRLAEQVVDYVKTLPEDTRIYWYGSPYMYMSGTGHPTLTFNIWDRPRFDVMPEGNLVPEAVPGQEAPAVYLFLPPREDEMTGAIASCPGGQTRLFMSEAGRKGFSGQLPDQTSFTAYEVLTPNHCIPPAPPPASAGS